MAKESATHPAPRIRWRTHCSVVSAASRTNSTRETLDRTCVQCVTVRVPPPLRRPCRQVLQRFPLRACQTRNSLGTLLLARLRASISPLFRSGGPAFGQLRRLSTTRVRLRTRAPNVAARCCTPSPRDASARSVGRACGSRAADRGGRPALGLGTVGRDEGGGMAQDWARPVVHWEIEATDPERQRAFYADLFNWKIGDGFIMEIPRRHRRARARARRSHPRQRALRRDALRAGGRPAGLARQVGRRSAPPSWPSPSTSPAARRWPASPTPRAIP